MQHHVRKFTNALAAVAFVPVYVLLDWASYLYPFGPFFITPWNPQPGLAVLLVLALGPAHVVTVAAAILVSDIVVRGTPGGMALAGVGAAVLASGYAALGNMLRTGIDDPTLHRLRDLTRFSLLVSGATAIIALAYVGTLYLWMQPVGMSWPRAWLGFWIGDLVGIFVTVPLLLVAADPGRRAVLRGMLRSREAWLQWATVLTMLALIFALHREEAARLFYLLFIPLVWVALRWGLPGAVVAATLAQLGVLVGMQQSATVLPIFELQALVAAFTMMGLFLGVASDERRESEERLRHSMRLAAAGEMAGAIAHEVNQPLTALGVYGESAQALLDRGVSQGELREILAKMVGEVRRTAQVMHRLRELFASGTTHLERVEVAELLESARRIGVGAIGSDDITLEVPQPPALPPLHIDRVQVELVLRNLLANSAQSLAASGRADGLIQVSAEPGPEGMVRIRVRDNGPGIPESTRERLFQPFVSGKPRGMGVGLAVSRSIAEAQGGALEAVSHRPIEFHLTLPCLTTS